MKIINIAYILIGEYLLFRVWMYKLLILIVLVFISASANSTQVVKTCLYGSSVFHLVDSKKVSSFHSIKILTMIAEHAGFVLDIKTGIATPRCMKLLYTEEVDVKAGLVMTEKRKVSYHMLPYARRFPAGIYTTKDSIYDENTDYSQLMVGAIKNYKTPEAFNHLESNIVRIGNAEKGFQMLLNKRFHAYITSSYTFERINAKPEFNGKFKLQKQQNNKGEYYYFAFARSPAGDKLYEQFKKSLQQLIDNHKIQPFKQQTKD